MYTLFNKKAGFQLPKKWLSKAMLSFNAVAVFLEKLWLRTANRLGLNHYVWSLVLDMVTSGKREKNGICHIPFVV